MPEHDWNERYQAGETPWDTGEPDDIATAHQGRPPPSSAWKLLPTVNQN